MFGPILTQLIKPGEKIRESFFIGVPLNQGKVSVDHIIRDLPTGVTGSLIITTYYTNCSALATDTNFDITKFKTWNTFTVTDQYKFEDGIDLPLAQYIVFVTENTTNKPIGIHFNMAAR